MSECIVVNLVGAPGAGKSTGAAYIFSRLKMLGINAELITEFAKDKVWEENHEIFKADNQVYLFGKQFYRMSRCRDKVDVLITDSPLVLSILYNKSEVLGPSFDNVVLKVFKSFNNMTYLLLRDKPYNPKGRHQTAEESDMLAGDLVKLLEENAVPYETKYGNNTAYDAIVDDVVNKLNEMKTNTK